MKLGNLRIGWWAIGLAAIFVLALALRLKGLHDPMLDHPGWRQGDEAAIARNFATLEYNPLRPQTDYDGPPPNYVELELQIVPFLAATLYKLFGIHEVFGRLITLAFSLGTVAVLAYFARWLFASSAAGLFAALLYAIMPGSLYYGRTFTPDATMAFFLTAALYASARMAVDEADVTWRKALVPTVLLSLAYLAKPVALLAIVPLFAVIWRRAVRAPEYRFGIYPLGMLLVAPLAVLYFYDHYERSIAEWHWASGIMRLHVMPALRMALTSGDGFVAKWHAFTGVLGMLATTMLGPALTAWTVLAFAFSRWWRARTPELLWGWLVVGLAYAYVVVTVERVDYYLFPLLPLAALAGGVLLARLCERLASSALPGIARATPVVIFLALVAVAWQNRLEVSQYYHYPKAAYQRAVALDATLAPGTLVVMGHYDPSVLYYINRKGWEEDPYLWTPFDEESAIRKGARAYIDIEHNRFAKNVELCAWMQRFPVADPQARWPVYQTDPSLLKPGAEAHWQAFRTAERRGQARAWLDARRLCQRRLD